MLHHRQPVTQMTTKEFFNIAIRCVYGVYTAKTNKIKQQKKQQSLQRVLWGDGQRKKGDAVELWLKFGPKIRVSPPNSSLSIFTMSAERKQSAGGSN